MTQLAKITFKFKRETKGTFLMEEDAPRDQQVVGSLYIKKTALPTADETTRLTVTIVQDS